MEAEPDSRQPDRGHWEDQGEEEEEEELVIGVIRTHMHSDKPVSTEICTMVYA